MPRVVGRTSTTARVHAGRNEDERGPAAHGSVCRALCLSCAFNFQSVQRWPVQSVSTLAGVALFREIGAESGMPFDLQPALEGDLIRLRPLRAEDWNALYAVASDPLMWEQHPSSDRYKEDVFREFFREALESGGALIVIDSKDGRVIGSSRF